MQNLIFTQSTSKVYFISFSQPVVSCMINDSNVIGWFFPKETYFTFLSYYKKTIGFKTYLFCNQTKVIFSIFSYNS